MLELISEEYKNYTSTFTCSVCGEQLSILVPSRHRDGRSPNSEWTELDSKEEEVYDVTVESWKRKHEYPGTNCWTKWYNPELSSIVFIDGKLSNDVSFCQYTIEGYRFGEIKHRDKTRYFLIDSENKIKEQYSKFCKFIFIPLRNYISEDYYSSVSGDFDISYQSVDMGVQSYTDGTKIHWCEYKEVGGNDSYGNSMIRFNSATGEFE